MCIVLFWQDLRAMLLIFSVQPPKKLNSLLEESLHYILQVCHDHQKQHAATAQTPSLKRSNSEQEQQKAMEEKEQGYNQLFSFILIDKKELRF